MKIGEIKAEAMRLMNVDLGGMAVENLALDENVSDLYHRLVGALNRGLTDLETKRVLPLKVAELTEPLYVVRDAAVFSLADIAGMLAPARLTVRGDNYIERSQPFSFEAGRLTVYGYDKHATYELYYHGTVERVSDVTPHGEELAIPRQLAEALPYFIKSDVYRVDEPGEANDARNWYENAVAQYAEAMACDVQGAVDTVYGGAYDAVPTVFGGFICDENEI